MNRRSFLTGAAALFAAPAIVRAESLMKIAIPEKKIILPEYEVYIGPEGLSVTRITGNRIKTGTIASSSDEGLITLIDAATGNCFFKGEITAGAI